MAELLGAFGETQGQYIFPREMPDCVAAVEEIMKKRPIISFRIFLNDIDSFIPQELAKAFVMEKFVERAIPPKDESSGSSTDSDAGKSKKSLRRKSSKGKVKRSKSVSSTGRRKSARRQSARRQSARRQSRRQSEKKERRQSEKKERRQSARRSSKRRQSGRRQSGRRQSSRRQSKGRASTRRQSTKKSKEKKKRKSPLGTQQPQMSKRKFGKYFKKLWPVHTLHRPQCHKRYDWLGDYSHLEEKRLTALQIQGFDPEKAKKKRNCNYVFTEEMKTSLRKKFWYYTRYMPEPPPILAAPDPKKEEEKKEEIKLPVELIVNQKIHELLEDENPNKPIDYYRKDMTTVEPNYEVYGSLSSKNRENVDKLSPEIKKVVKYISSNPTNPKEFKENIFTCTTFVCDISTENADIDEAKTIFDLLISTLTSMEPEYRVKLQALFGIHTYFLISPLMTWGESIDLAKIAADNIVREEYFPKRIPHPRYKKHYDFENYVHDKSYQYKDILRILIIGVGLVYGPGGHLDKYIDLARENKSFLPIFGTGKNQINVIHSSELARLIIFLLLNFPHFAPYIVAAEKRPVTQKEILDVVSSCLAESYTKMVPFCFNKTFGIPQNALDVMTTECNIFPSYLNDVAGWSHNKGCIHDACNSLLEYIESGNSKPLRLVFFGPFSLDQTKIAMEVSKKYSTIYINPSKAVYILLRLIERMQDIIESMSSPKATIDEKFRVALGESKINKFNILRLLAWQREFRRFMLRSKSLVPIREKADKNFNLKLNEYLSEAKSPDDKAKGPDNLLGAAKAILARYEKLTKNAPNNLIPARLEVVAEIIHELLQHPILKFTGYILDGTPATEVEAEIIFTRTQGLGGAEDKPPPPESKETKDSKKQTSEKEKPPEKEKTTAELKFSGHYERLPSFVFHTAKKSSACLKDCVTLQAKSFQKEYMDKFQHLEFYKHNVGKIKSTLDFFTSNTTIVPITFDTSRESIPEILDHIYHIIGDPENYAGKLDPTGKIYAQNETHSRSDSIKNSISEEEREEEEKFSQEVFDEMKLLADRCLPYGYYLNRFLFKNLIDALIQTCIEDPDDPIDFFSEYLFKNNTEGRMPRDKILPPPKRYNLDTYPFDVPKSDLQFSTHL